MWARIVDAPSATMTSVRRPVWLPLLLVACAGSQRRAAPTPAPPCPMQAKIEAHQQEAYRLSDAAHEARRRGDEARRKLAAPDDDATRAAAQVTIDAMAAEAAVYFGTADEHYFEAERLGEACDSLAPAATLGRVGRS